MKLEVVEKTASIAKVVVEIVAIVGGAAWALYMFLSFDKTNKEIVNKIGTQDIESKQLEERIQKLDLQLRTSTFDASTAKAKSEAQSLSLNNYIKAATADDTIRNTKWQVQLNAISAQQAQLGLSKTKADIASSELDVSKKTIEVNNLRTDRFSNESELHAELVGDPPPFEGVQTTGMKLFKVSLTHRLSNTSQQEFTVSFDIIDVFLHKEASFVIGGQMEGRHLPVEGYHDAKVPVSYIGAPPSRFTYDPYADDWRMIYSVVHKQPGKRFEGSSRWPKAIRDDQVVSGYGGTGIYKPGDALGAGENFLIVAKPGEILGVSVSMVVNEGKTQYDLYTFSRTVELPTAKTAQG